MSEPFRDVTGGAREATPMTDADRLRDIACSHTDNSADARDLRRIASLHDELIRVCDYMNRTVYVHSPTPEEYAAMASCRAVLGKVTVDPLEQTMGRDVGKVG